MTKLCLKQLSKHVQTCSDKFDQLTNCCFYVMCYRSRVAY